MTSLKKGTRLRVSGIGRSLRRSAIGAVALALVAAVLSIAGLTATAGATTPGAGDCTYEWVRSIPQSHAERKYKKTIPAVQGVKEYKYKKPVKAYKTQHWAKYQKHVKGRVEKKYGHNWYDTGVNFDWTKWEGAFWNTNGSFKVRDWADVASPDVIEEGSHSSASDVYIQNGYYYRQVSERYSYRVIERQTRQVEISSTWEYSDWTTEVRGAPWIKVDERWKVEPKAAYDVYYVTGGGSTTTNTDANWTRETPGSPWVKFEEKTVQDQPINQGPVRSATEPDRGQYPNVPWTKVPGSEVCPDGSSNYTLTCESITLSAPTGVTPTGSQSRYLIDGVVKLVGTYPVSVGDHTITLEVLVDGSWKKVDEDRVSVEKCPVEVNPVNPTVNQSECVNGSPSAPTLTTGSTTGIVYTVSPAGPFAPGQTVVVTATWSAGSKQPASLPAGWVKVSAASATYSVTFTTPDCTTPPPPPTPLPGTATATAGACVQPGQATGVITVTVTNTDDATNQAADYTVQVSGPDGTFAQAKKLTIADGASAPATFNGLPAGVYPIAVTAADGTKVNLSVAIQPCETTPPPPTKAKKVKVVVKKIDKCESNNFYFVKKVKGAHVLLGGKKVREGVWLETGRSRVVLKAVVDGPKYKLRGKTRFVLKFPNDRSCGKTPSNPPPTGG